MKKTTFEELNRRIETLESMLNGGKGSGNFGHTGRPGQVGGSGGSGISESKDSGVGRPDGPDITQHIANTAKNNIDKAEKEEGEVSATLGEALNNNDSVFAGFKYRLKTKSSLADKISRDLLEKRKAPTNKNIQEVAGAIHDNLRYTALCNENTFGEQYKGIMKGLEDKGYEVMRVKNTLKDKNAIYRGVNTLVKNKRGYIFELQFHTAQSLEVKNRNHIDYDIARDPKTSFLKRARLNKAMSDRSKSVRSPRGVNEIESFNKMEG